MKTYYTTETDKGYTMFYSDGFNIAIGIFIISFFGSILGLGLYILNYVGVLV